MKKTAVYTGMLVLFGAITLLITPGIVHAQTTSTIEVDGSVISYTDIIEFDADDNGTVDYLQYYASSTLVLSTSDTNNDGVADAWLVYDELGGIRRQILDIDGDTSFDLVVTFDESQRVQRIEDLRPVATTSPIDTPQETVATNEHIPVSQNQTTVNWIIAVVALLLAFGIVWKIRN